MNDYAVAADAPITDIIGILDEHGFVVIAGLVAGSVMDQLAAEAAPFVERSARGRDHYDGEQTRRTGALMARCPTARKLAMHPVVNSVVARHLGHATTYQLHLTQLITIEPGETDQKPHRDQMAFDFFPFPAEYHVQCNTMWALTDFTEENGATRLAPGSGRLGDADAEQVKMVHAEMPRGSVLIYDGKVLHGAGANRSRSARQGVNITYSVGWVRQEENQFLACPPEVARTLDDDLLRLMGYQQGAFALGYVGDQQDPLAVLRGTNEKVKTVGAFREVNPSFREFVDDLAERPDH